MALNRAARQNPTEWRIAPKSALKGDKKFMHAHLDNIKSDQLDAAYRGLRRGRAVKVIVSQEVENGTDANPRVDAGSAVTLWAGGKMWDGLTGDVGFRLWLNIYNETPFESQFDLTTCTKVAGSRGSVKKT